MKRILVNIPTTQNDKISPDWLRILRFFQSKGCEIFVNAGIFVKKLNPIGDVYQFEWLDENERRKLTEKRAKTKIGFMFHALRRFFATLKNSRRIIDENGINVVYAPSSVFDFVIYPFYLKIRGKKIKWATSLANLVPFTDPGNRLIRFLAWIFFQAGILLMCRADAVFAPTLEIRDYLLRRGFPYKKVVETGFAVENEMIEKANRIEGLNIDALFIGRINETKGIFDMLKVLDIVTKKHPDFQLAIVGDGDKNTKKKFKKKIAELDLKKNVRFFGFVAGKRKYDIIKSARSFWFLSVSKSESFGMALLEAVCSGIPAFTYDLPQFSRIYKNGEVDISSKGDYELVSQKIIKLFEDGNFSNEKGKLLIGKYSWEKIAEIEYNAIKNL